MILRIEDTDSTRFVPNAEEYINESLAWLGIKIDEDKFAFSDCDFIEKSSLINTGEEKNA